jgi:hypothetical protein
MLTRFNASPSSWSSGQGLGRIVDQCAVEFDCLYNGGRRAWDNRPGMSQAIAKELIRQIHTRMPVIQAEDRLDVWLSGEVGKEILVSAVSDGPNGGLADQTASK